jgi:ketosteroid isomerase-like protein
MRKPLSNPLRAALCTLIPAAVLAACATPPPQGGRQVMRNTDRYSRLSPQDVALISPGENAFMNRDAAGAAASVAEDFSWWMVGEDGPKQVVAGREATMKLISRFFGATNFDSKVYRLGLVGNILVQVEVDTLQTERGPVEKTSLELYEFRDGKRWREWRFAPLANPLSSGTGSSADGAHAAGARAPANAPSGTR